MSTTEKLPAILNVEALVAPISDELPCGTSREHGEDIDLSVAYGQIREDFDMARRIERARAELDLLVGSQRLDVLESSKGRPDSPSEVPRWDRIITQSELILTKHSKDMRVVNWLTEAATRLHGFVGLRDSLDLCYQLIQRYGMNLFPVSADDKLCCYRPVRNLSTSPSLISALKQISFRNGAACHYTGYDFAKHMNTLSVEEQKEHERMGKMTLDAFSTVIRECSVEEIDHYYQQIDQALEATKKLDEIMFKLSDKESFSINKITEQLEQLRSWFQALCNERPAQDPAESTPESGQGSGESAGGTAGSGPKVDPVATALRSREDALNQLIKVAKFFRSTEPHSPLSYALEKAVRWGKMDLPDLLKEVVSDSTSLQDIYRLFGIKEKEENDR